MKNDIHLWLYTLFTCGCITSMILFLMPDERSRGIAELGCSCIMILALIFPLTNVDFTKYLSHLSMYSKQINEEIALKQTAAAEINKEIIEERFEEYILNEAALQDIKLESVSVDTIQSDDAYYIPIQALYYSNDPVSEKFMEHIEVQLGISKERQILYEVTGNNQQTIDP